MNALQSYIALHDLDEIEVMNELQDNGIISDNCILAEDVANADCQKAIDWIESNPYLTP